MEKASNDFEKLAAEEAGSNSLTELWGFLRHNKKWWMVPILVILLLMSVCGSAVALAVLARDRFHPYRRHTSQQMIKPSSMHRAGHGGPPRPTVPYGVAIAGAGIVILILKPVL